MKWTGIYQMATDTFLIEPYNSHPHKIQFTSDEQAQIDLAANGRTHFEWDPDHSKLTRNSQAWWAMM